MRTFKNNTVQEHTGEMGSYSKMSFIRNRNILSFSSNMLWEEWIIKSCGRRDSVYQAGSHGEMTQEWTLTWQQEWLLADSIIDYLNILIIACSVWRTTPISFVRGRREAKRRKYVLLQRVYESQEEMRTASHRGLNGLYFLNYCSFILSN